jgi:hypothetical protein
VTVATWICDRPLRRPGAAPGFDGDGLLLLPQHNLRANIGKLVVAARPDFMLSDMLADQVAAVAHVSRVRSDGDLGWAQISGEMLIAALRDAIKRGMGEGAVQMTGIRVVGTRPLFLKGTSDVSLAAPKPSDSFAIPLLERRRGGPLEADQGRVLGPSECSERRQLLLLLTALGTEIRARHAAMQPELHAAAAAAAAAAGSRRLGAIKSYRISRGARRLSITAYHGRRPAINIAISYHL